MTNIIYTIGHSTHRIDDFVHLLKRNAITAVADVRSSPYSRINPQFNRETLQIELKKEDIQYVFLGAELGARSDDPNCYRNNKVRYDLLAKTNLFKSGLDRVRAGAERFRVALMCAEKEPLECHRTLLVARKLVEQGISVKHILADGRIETHEESLARLLSQLNLFSADFFRSKEDAVLEAYERQGDAIAYSLNTPDDECDEEEAEKFSKEQAV